MFKLYLVPRVSHLTAPWSERGEGALRTRLVQARYESYIVTKKKSAVTWENSSLHTVGITTSSVWCDVFFNVHENSSLTILNRAEWS